MMPQHKTVWWCPTCEASVTDEPERVAMYQCGECGAVFSRNDHGSSRCEQCNKFSGRVADMCCPSCGENTEDLEEREMLVCPFCDDDEIDNAYAEEELHAHLTEFHPGEMADKVLAGAL